MPELPEVETVCRFLNHKICHRKIINIELIIKKLLINSLTFEKLSKILIGSEIDKITRRGKYLLFHINESVLIIHLRMEGKFYWSHQTKQIPKYTLFWFEFNHEQRLFFADFRKFATFDLINIADLSQYFNKKIGLEPFDHELTSKYLEKKWKNRKINIKKALLEQKVIAGIGNIYASEILFAAQIHPEKLIKQLTALELEKIIKFTRKILKKAIEQKGSTIKSFQINNEAGRFQNSLKVYQREGKKCFICNSNIDNLKIQNRSTFFCVTCQKK